MTRRRFASVRVLRFAAPALLIFASLAAPAQQSSSAAKSVAGLSSLPANAQGLVLTALGKNESRYLVHPSANYPMTTDPWIQQAELTASDGAESDGFGNAVAYDGTMVVVGAAGHNGMGAAYVFVQSGGIWSQQAELTASDGASGDIFGQSVAISGGTIVVGSPYHTVGSTSYQGAAYVFVQNGTTWSQQAELIASDGANGDELGTSVAVLGGTAFVGSPGHSGQGALYLFAQSGGAWTQQAELTASDGTEGDGFGLSLAVDANSGTAVAGAPCHPYTPGEYPYCGPGAAYVFAENGDTWTQQAELAAGSVLQDGFSNSVGVSGTTVVAGAPYYPGIRIEPGDGAAFVFADSGGTWTYQETLTVSDLPGDIFGASVAVSGATAMAGSPPSLLNVYLPPDGAVYVFVQSGTSWSQQQELVAADAESGDTFGDSIALSGSTALVGAQDHTFGSNLQQGAAYVFGSSGPLYTLSAAPSSLSVQQGGQATSTITITPYNGFSDSVSFSASGLPSGVTAAFTPDSATSTTALTLTASANAQVTTSPVPPNVLLIGSSGNLAQTTLLPLTVNAGPEVTLSPASLDFGDEAVNNTSVAKTVNMKNTGNAFLGISGFTASAGFAVSSTMCGSTLAVGKKCGVSVTFTPTHVGPATGTLSITDNAGNSPQTVALSGTGIVQAILTPSSLTFAKTKVGTTSSAKEVTLKNNLPTTLTGISYSAAAPFAVSASTCGATLDSKTSCTIRVTFSPTQTGPATGTLSVSDSANNSPQTASLAGTGN